MSNIINVEVVFDAGALLTKYGHQDIGSNSPGGKPDNPLGVWYEDIYMVGSANYVIDGQATAQLNIKANVGDEIRWAGISLSENISYSVIIYEINWNPDKKNSVQVTPDPSPNVVFPMVPIPDTNNPVKYGIQTVPEYFLSSNISARGWEAYLVKFYITQNDSGTPTTLGYFYWDPSIDVS